MPYGCSSTQMVCVEIVWERLVWHMVRVTICTLNSLKILALCCSVGYNSETFVVIQHYNAVCHLYIHEAPWSEGQGTSQFGVQTGPNQLSPQDQGILYPSLQCGPPLFHFITCMTHYILLFLIKYRKASRQKRKEKKRWRNPGFPVSLDLSVGQAALKQGQVSRGF